MTEKNETDSLFERSTGQEEMRPNRKPSASFYEHFTSLLRVKSNVSDLCQVKTNLKLPELQSKNDFSLKASNLLSNRRFSEQVSEISPGALRSYLLSNTAKEQYEIATQRNQNSEVKRRVNASPYSR